MPELSGVERSIKHCIEKNGFPEKSIRLPFKSIHESCKNHNTALKEVLANLTQHKIFGPIQGDFIEFPPAIISRKNHMPQSKQITHQKQPYPIWMISMKWLNHVYPK